MCVRSSFFISLIHCLLQLHCKILRKECFFDANFSQVTEGIYLVDALTDEFNSDSAESCIRDCILKPNCESISYNENLRKCAIFNNIILHTQASSTVFTDWVHYQTDSTTTMIGHVCESLNPCAEYPCEDTCTPLGYECKCPQYFDGMRCEHFKLYSTCKNALDESSTNSVSIMPHLNDNATVACSYNGIHVVIKFGHDKEEETFSNGNSENHKINLHYDHPWEFMLTAIRNSKSCNQTIYVRSSNNYGTTFVVSDNQIIKVNDKRCHGCKHLFHNFEKREGIGYITDKRLLPIKRARIKDTEGRNEYVYISFGKLMCIENEA